ncbi:MAG: hypothetical protein K9G49_04580 [Taibaiella sp.]|nr:hypothetical protein [Taibaiella sp.]
MTIENKVLDTLDPSPVVPFSINEPLIINNCVINKLIISGGESTAKMLISNSIISEISAVGRYFNSGLEISNCIINKVCTFEATGNKETKAEIVFENNIFGCFVDFLDAYYTGPFIFRNNILLAGSSLLGNKGTMVETSFLSGSIIENNIGDLYMD